RHTRFSRDWSSDVCSSDLYLAKAGHRCLLLEGRPIVGGGVKTAELTLKGFKDDVCSTSHAFLLDNPMIKNDELPLRDYGLEYIRSEERRVGKECRSWGASD